MTTARKERKPNKKVGLPMREKSNALPKSYREKGRCPFGCKDEVMLGYWFHRDYYGKLVSVTECLSCYQSRRRYENG